MFDTLRSQSVHAWLRSRSHEHLAMRTSVLTLVLAACFLQDAASNPVDSPQFIEADVIPADSELGESRVIRKRQSDRFFGNGFNENGRPGFPDNFDENFGQNFPDNFPRPNRPGGFRPNRPSANEDDDMFIWGTNQNRPQRPRPRPTQAPTTTTRRTPGQQEETTGAPAGRPIENACTRRCFQTTTYNPVCGTDNITYPNPTRLECAQNCGIQVSVAYYSACRAEPNRVFPTRPEQNE